MTKRHTFNELILALTISIFTYAAFFYPLLNSNNFLDGSDALKHFYPVRYYFDENIKAGRFPFWTEKVFGGFPIYADSENAYLNPINIISILLFGPFNSYKVLHLFFYLFGSLSFYFFLKKKEIDLKGFFIANTIYFFSFFGLYHLQHFSFIFGFYVFPAALLLLDIFIEKKQLRYLIYYCLLISTIIYFGSYQSSLLLISGSLLYYLLFENAINFKKKILNILLIVYLTFAFTIPQLLPTYQLYLQSYRVEGGISFKEGSFIPGMLVNVFYPYFFEKDASYKWNQISGEFLIHETYIYVGIVSLILAAFGLFKIKDTKFKRYLTCLILLFLILGFLAYIPVFNRISIPILSLFRYWGRSVWFFTFAIACMVAYFISFKSERYSSKKSYAILIISVVVLQLFGLFYKETFSIITLTLNGAFQINIQLLIWVILICLTLILLVIEHRIPFVKYVLCFLIFLDLFIFGRNISLDYIRNLDYLFPHETAQLFSKFENERILYLDREGFWNFGLYYPSWGILGYSQFTPASYLNYFKEFGITTTEEVPIEIPDILHSLGVTTLISSDGVTSFDTKIFQDFDGEILNKDIREGKINLLIYSNKVQELNTRIRNYKDWRLSINGELRNFTSSEDDLFLKFDLNKGVNHLQMNYVPMPFYIGLSISFILLSVFICAKIFLWK